MSSAPLDSFSQSNSVTAPSTSSSNPPKRAVVCVFCGSSSGTSTSSSTPSPSNPHLAAANALAHAFAAHNMSLVYGGGTVGLMGEVARTLVSLSGPESVHGIIPDALIQFEQESRQDTASTSNHKPSMAALINEKIYGRTTVVADMHARKQLMAKEVMQGGPGSGFVALSGGYGTMEELMEMTTWNQLGIHRCGVVVFNVDGYYDGLIQWVRTAVSSGFITPGNGGIVVEALDAEEVVRQLREYRVSKQRFNLDWSQK